MDKVRFLRREYMRITSSGAFVSEAWRASEEQFLDDMMDRTPNYRSGRYLAPINRALGYIVDNVEWHFEPSVQLKAKLATKKSPPKKAAVKISKPKKPTAEQLRARLEAEREARRQTLVDEFKRWERRYRFDASSSLNRQHQLLHLNKPDAQIDQARRQFLGHSKVTRLFVVICSIRHDTYSKW